MVNATVRRGGRSSRYRLRGNVPPGCGIEIAAGYPGGVSLCGGHRRPECITRGRSVVPPAVAEVLRPDGADPVAAQLVFLDLLERDVQTLGNVRLCQATQHAQVLQLFTDMFVYRM